LIRPRIFIEDLRKETIQQVFDRQTTTTPYGIRVQVMNGATILSDEYLDRNYFTGAAPTTGVDDYQWIPQVADQKETALISLVTRGMTGNYLRIYTTDDAGNESPALIIT